jgi:hypothetical protein
MGGSSDDHAVGPSVAGHGGHREPAKPVPATIARGHSPASLILLSPGGPGRRVAGQTRRTPGARAGDTSRGAAPARGATPTEPVFRKLALVAPWPDHPVPDPLHLEIVGIFARHVCGPSPRCTCGVLVRWAVHGCLGHRLRTNRSENELAIAMQRGQNGWGIADHFGRSPSGFRKGHLLIGTAHKYADGHVLYRREAIRTTRGVTLARPPCDLRGRTLA